MLDSPLPLLPVPRRNDASTLTTSGLQPLHHLLHRLPLLLSPPRVLQPLSTLQGVEGATTQPLSSPYSLLRGLGEGDREGTGSTDRTRRPV
ncbi:unnamed protein product [Gadus morhua 'NCC']